MNSKLIEGMVGARNSMQMSAVPMKVFLEARAKGDTETMDRAMGYVGKSAQEAHKYADKADAGLKEEVEKAREEERLEREKALAENGKSEKVNAPQPKQDVVELSEQGRAMLEDYVDQDTSAPKGPAKTSDQPVMYTKSGEISKLEQKIVISVSV